MQPLFEIVVAADQNNGIGLDGDLPWKLPGDLRFFKELTMGDGNNVVIMGRKTWQSIPDRFRPLDRRINIVLSRQQLDLPAGVLLAGSLNKALDICENELPASVNRVFVIGGGQIYAEAFTHPNCSRVYLTRVMGEFACDAFLLGLDKQWQSVACSETHTDNSIPYHFETLERRA
ncbi:MAG: dihydrofolate reductase [Planctomycetes bacterium]|nr:dihydrofolate reductase [Planctomycetota bacterium]